MKQQFLCFIALLFSVFAEVKAQNIPPSPSIYEDGILHVKIKDSCQMEFVLTDSLGNLDTSQLIIQGINFNYFDISKIEKTFKILGQNNTQLYRIYTFYFPSHIVPNALIDSLLKLPCVEYVERLPKISKFYTPSDIRPQTGTPNQWYLYTIKAKEAWDVHHGPGTKQIKIAIVDDAVWLNHPDLTGVIYTNTAELNDGIDNDNNGYIDDMHGWDAADKDNNPNPPFILPPGEDFAHGTHVAAIAGAQTDVGSPGMASIGFGVQLIPVKIGLDTTGKLFNAYAGVEYAIAAGANVINMSWGGPGYSSSYDKMMSDARARGIVLVAAAGNDSVTSLMYPASYPAVISVGATNSGDQKTGFSNYNTSIDVMAPGENIYSALYDPSGIIKYGNLSGTSMASPLVAGLCGLMLSYNPDLTPDVLENCLKANCDNINAQNTNYQGMIGSGRINAEKTMKCLQTSPIVEFTSNFQTVCQGKTIKFACNFTSGSNSPTYSWSFPGGNPSTSTSANPAVIYSNAGVYSVSVVISNAFGSTTLTKTNYITVKSVNGNYNYGVLVDNNWFMHKGLALKFPKSSVANPQFIIEGSQFPPGPSGALPPGHGEGCASISNYDGQPLFYSNGLSVFNRHHQVMSNGSGLSPGYQPWRISTISQNTIIVPDPNECSSRYYLFHLNPDGLLYSVIDMDGDNGLGTVIQKNIPAGNPFPASEHLTAIMHCNGKDVWVIAHEMNSNVFRAYLVTEMGVRLLAVISNVGFANNNNQGGQMKGSPSGDKIARAIKGFNDDLSQIFDFDKGTGKVSNAIKFNTSTLNGSQKSNSGIEFSPDGSKIYLVGSSLVQYDLNGFSASTLPTVIASSIPGGWGFSGTLELGPDGKIYASKTSNFSDGYTKLDVINTPNRAGALCNLIPNGMPLANPNGINHFEWGLNNSFISKTLNYHKQIHQISYNVVICNGATTTLDAGPGAIYNWEGSQSTRKIVVSTAGNYPVVITNANGCKTKIVFVVTNETAVLDLGPDRTVRCGTHIGVVLDAGIGFTSYLWSTGKTTSSIIATAPGLYWVEATTPGGCKFRDEVYISPEGSPQQLITRIDYTCGSPGIDLYALNINRCPLVHNGSTTPWLSSIADVPAPRIVEPIGNMTFRREVMDSNGCVYCIQVIEITFKQASKVLNTVQLACEGAYVGISPPSDPPCNTATSWEYFYPDGTSDFATPPFSLSTPAINGDVFKIRSYLPNGCYCDYITSVIVTGPVIKKKTITINCGELVNLEDYGIEECPNNSIYYWGETADQAISSVIVSPKETKTYYRTSYNSLGCLDCILELTVVVNYITEPINYTIEVPCGSQLDMESIAGCNGIPGTFYWHDGFGSPSEMTSVFIVTKNTTFYRESLDGCPCPSKVTVIVTNPPVAKIDIPQTHCIGKVFNFESLCPPAIFYKLIDPYGYVIGISLSPNFSKEVMTNGTYKVVAVYENGCTCTTEYRSNLLEPSRYQTTDIISFCTTITTVNPAPICLGADHYKWFSDDYYSSVLSEDGSLTFEQRLLLLRGPNDPIPNIHDNQLRIAYDKNGCIICIERYNIAAYSGPSLAIEATKILCEGECYTFNFLDKFFPNLQRCQFNLVSPPDSNYTTTTTPDGTITVCANTIPQGGYYISFRCRNPQNECDFNIVLRISKALCKKGSDDFTGIETGVNDYTINIFPNPTTGDVTLDMKGSAGIVKNIQVFDVLGRRVIAASVTEEQKEFNFSEFSKGVYTIRIATEEKVYTQKVVLK